VDVLTCCLLVATSVEVGVVSLMGEGVPSDWNSVFWLILFFANELIVFAVISSTLNAPIRTMNMSNINKKYFDLMNSPWTVTGGILAWINQVSKFEENWIERLLSGLMITNITARISFH